MIGAIIGDISGSKYEFNNIKTKDFPLLSKGDEFTDDTIMSLAVAKALMESEKTGQDFKTLLVKDMQDFGRRYPSSYGGRFAEWIYERNPKPYNSFGNGSAMRVSACGLAAQSLEEAEKLGKESAEVTHNHPEGIKGAVCTAGAIYLAKTGKSKEEIRDYVSQFYPMNQSVDEIRPDYYFNETCQQTVPQAITCFLDSTDFEDTIRNSISIGGDSDTVAAIAGSIAWPYYQNHPEAGQFDPAPFLAMLPKEFIRILDQFDEFEKEKDSKPSDLKQA